MVYCIKGFEKSIKIAPQNHFLTKHDFHLSEKNNSAYCVMNNFPYPQDKRKLVVRR